MNTLFSNLLFLLGLFVGIVLVFYWLVKRSDPYHESKEEWYDNNNDYFLINN